MRGLGLVVYGVEGIGKTSFALQFPKPMSFMPIREPGLDNLAMVGEVPNGVIPLRCQTWPDVLKAVGSCSARTLVIDAISGMQEYLVEYVTNTVYGGSYKAFKSFYNGLRQDCPREIMLLLNEVEVIRNKGTHVIFIAHRKNTVDPDSGGPDVQIQTLYGDEGITGPIIKWAQGIVFMAGKRNIDIVTESSGYGQDTKVLEGKATQAPTRLMYTQFSGYHVAKNTLRLPPVIPMGRSAEESYKNFVNACPEVIQKLLT